jgi:hypothetical protein
MGARKTNCHPSNFSEKYERKSQADFLAAQVVEIADTVRKGSKVRVSAKDGITEEHGHIVDRSG